MRFNIRRKRCDLPMNNWTITFPPAEYFIQAVQSGLILAVIIVLWDIRDRMKR